MKPFIRILRIISLTTIMYGCGTEVKKDSEVTKEVSKDELQYQKKKDSLLKKQREDFEKLIMEREDRKLKLDDIVGKTEREVEKVLGKHKSVETTKYGPKLVYNNIEIVFINGRSDWITLNMSRNEFVLPSISMVSIDTFDKGTNYEYTYIKCFNR